MKKNRIINSLVAGAFALFSMQACTDYVQNIEEPIDNVADAALNTPADVHFLAVGVLNTWATTWDEHSLFADGMSDAFEFTRDIRQATYTTYEAIDNAIIQGSNPLLAQNNSTESIFRELGRLRLYADTLVTRVQTKIAFTTDEEKAYQAEGLFTGYFMGAVARYMYATYWALNPTSGGGGVINKSAFIPAATLYTDAIARLDEAAKYADELQIRQINTFKARIYLIQGKFAEAKTAADAGMLEGDESFDAKYNTIGANQWYTWAGPGRTQFHAADRFGEYVYEDPNEAARIPLYLIAGQKKITFERDTIIAGVSYPAGTPIAKKYQQQKIYTEFGSPIKFLTWQENALMLAELAIRNGNDKATALSLVNSIRSGYGINPLTDEMINAKFSGDYLEMLYVERDKQLAFTGLRLIDQRRFDKWHLDKTKTWQFMPIGYAELMANPNL